jgi:two-component system sensor histidine kinase BaeS
MGKSILFKLWITFFFALALALSAMLFFTHWSMQKGFIDYITHKSVKRLTTLEQALVQIHHQQGSWDIVGRRPGLWNRLRREAIMSQMDDDNRDYRRYLENFFEPLILTDADRQVIVGNPTDRHYHWHGVMDDEHLLGYIGYIKPNRLIRTVDRLFVERQIRIYLLASLVCLLLSSLVAWLLSRRFVKPIRRLSSGARTLAAGDYNLRIEAQTDDELGRLCHHFNELARTLEANEQSRRQWVADISHEMRTPLAVMKAQIEALQDGIRAPSAENLALVHNKVNALSRLIDDLYELSLSDLGALSYHKEPLALSDVLQECLEDYEQKFAAASLDLQVDIQLSGRDLIYGDTERLIQLFHNLMENSSRYTQRPGKVRLSARRQSGEFIIALEDSAPGVDSEQTELIFDRLYRLETSRNRATGGAGLGLSICKNIVVAHQGRISAEESALGGLKILIHFPVLRA